MTTGRHRLMLVILDLNGVLLYRRSKGRLVHNTKPDAYVGGRATFVRPHARNFIDKLIYNGHQVAIWTTAMRHNAKIMLNILNLHVEELLFLWTADECCVGTGLDEKGKRLLTKPLQKVWSYFPSYNQDNTLLIDDSRLKTAMNPLNTVHIPTPYCDPDNFDDALSTNGSISLFVDKYN